MSLLLGITAAPAAEAGGGTIPDGADLWLDAAATASITEATGGVSQWTDLSGEGNHATQALSAYRPSYDSGVAVDLGASDSLSVSAPSATFDLYAVATLAPFRQLYHVLWRLGSNYQFLVRMSTGDVGNYYGTFHDSALDWSAEQRKLARIRGNAGALSIAVDDAALVATGQTVGTGTVVLGNGTSTGSITQGFGLLHEIIRYPRLVTAPEDAAIRAHLVDKWSVTA